MSSSVLHFTFNGEYVLLPSLHINSFGGFMATSLFSIFVCLLERLVTFASGDQWTPNFIGDKPLHVALWRSGLYWLATFLRLIYMIIAMSQNAALILIVVTSLSVSHFFLELRKLCRENRPRYKTSQYVELAEDVAPLSIPQAPATRPRSKSKPDELFIHPLQSNVARADAAALQLGMPGDSQRVRVKKYEREDPAWQSVAGRDAARRLLGDPQPSSASKQFSVGDESDSENSEF